MRVVLEESEMLSVDHFFVLHTKINDFPLDKENILEFIFDPLASKIHQEES